MELLELAANDDVENFKILIENDEYSADAPGPWYCRKNSSNFFAFDQRTPLMIAATYGSLDVLRLIVNMSNLDVNQSCGEAGTTALHCAASGGSANAVETVRILLVAGADIGIVDADGNRPADVIRLSLGIRDAKIVLEELLGKGLDCLRVCTSLSSASGDDGDILSPSSGSTYSPTARKDGSEKKEYPIDPSFPDIKNGIYATDEFRMFSFKVQPCSRAYSHDWTECPFVHPGENARRRDPRKYHYSCVPCPEFRKGACRRGDLCEYAHGVFECWLHPAQYRTKLCKDGTACARPVCFFAHTGEELRPLYVSTGLAVPSPWSSASAMEMAAAMMSIMPGSPSSFSAMSQNHFVPAISPSTNGIGSLGRQQPSVPTLHLAGSNNLHSSRLRSSLSARDMTVDKSAVLSDFDELCFRSNEARFARSKTFKPSNLDELFSAEISSSPRFNSDQAAVFSSSHKSAVFNQFQLQQQQSSLSPINTNSVFSLLAADTHRISRHNPLLSPAISSPGRMSPRSSDARSPLSARVSQFSHQEKPQQLGSVGSPVNSAWTRWGSPSGKPDWGVNGEEIDRFRTSAGIEWGSGVKQTDISWVQPLVNPPDANGKHGAVSGNGGTNSNDQAEEHTVLGAWLEHMQLDQLVA